MRKRSRITKPIVGQKMPPPVSVPPLTRGFVSLTSFILAAFQQPANWPLSDSERISFVKTVYYRARVLSDTEEYRRLELEIAAADVAPSVRKGTEKHPAPPIIRNPESLGANQ